MSFRRPSLPFVVLVLLTGCGGGEGSGGTPGTWAPQVTYSFPDSGIQDLAEGGSLTFSAVGEDIDSLDLEWEWLLDEAITALGEVTEGSFDESWTLEWSGELSGFLHDVSFVVRDPEGNSTELYWPVQVD
jgi:hypothetical protein